MKKVIFLNTDDSIENLPEEIINYFHTRTHKHIGLVNKLAKKIINFLPKKIRIKILLDAISHDRSKYSKEEKKSYIIITAIKNKTDHLEYIYKPIDEKKYKEITNLAWTHHYKNNPHHPEFWTTIDKEMPKFQLALMICDWGAMSIEFKNSLSEYIDNNINKKEFNFNDEQKLFIKDISNKLINNHKQLQELEK